MGYRQPNKNEKPNIWMKPVGFHLFQVDVDTQTWTNWFMGPRSGELTMWTSKTLSDNFNVHGDYEVQIQSIEGYSRMDIQGGGNFAFLTREEQIAMYLSF